MAHPAAPAPPSPHLAPVLPAGRGWAAGEAAWAAAAAFLLYLLLQQHTLYSVDAHAFLIQAQRVDFGLKATHYAYQPLLTLAAWLGQRCGLELHTAAATWSALGTALGVAAMHLANRRCGAERGTAWLATAAAATAPAVVFFATVVEIHGPHLAWCGPAFLATVWFAERPGAGRGVVLGAATGLGFAGHATGALLPALLLPVAWALGAARGAGWRGWAAGAAVALLAHALAMAALAGLASGLGAPAAERTAVSLFAMHLRGLLQAPAAVFDALWRDYGGPFAPLAAVPLVAVWWGRTRAMAAAVLVGVAVYTVATAALLIPFLDGVAGAGHGSERGAYLLPLAWPLGLLFARAVRWRGLRLLVLVAGLLLAVGQVRSHDSREQAGFAAGFRAVAGAGPVYVLVGSHAEVAAFLLDLPERRVDADWQVLLPLFTLPAERLELGWQAFEAWLGEKHRRGVALWLTAGGRQLLAEPGQARAVAGASLFLRRLQERFDWQEQRAAGFLGWRLAPR